MSKYICGKNSVKEALKNKVPIKKIYFSNKLNINLDSNIELKKISKHQLDKIASKTNHQGIIAEIEKFNYFNIKDIFEDKPQKILILDHIQDPYNFGAIIRTSNALGIKHIIIPKKRSIKVTPIVLKVSSGGQIGIKIIRVDSLNSIVDKLKNNNFWIFATTLNKNSASIKNIRFNYPMALILGNESKGVSKTLLKKSHQNIHIKLKGNVQSLNVSVAAGIFLFKI